MMPRRYIEVVVKTYFHEIKIAGLAIEFTLSKTVGGEPNEGEITIWNLDEGTANDIRVSGKEIYIRAGYEENSGVIFSGDIRNVSQGRTHSGKLGAIKSEVQNVQKGVNYLTKIKIGGNYRKLTESYFAKSYKGTSDIRTIATDAAKAIGLAIDGLGFLPAKTFEDFAFSGRAADLLDLITSEPYPSSWYEDNGVIHFHGFGTPITEVVHRISESSGLLGAPELLEDGIRLTTMLNPAITLAHLIELESAQLPQANGEWKIRSLEYSANNREDDHLIEIEAIPYEG